MNYQKFQLKLTKLIDDDYRAFAIKGILTKYPFLGVRTPDLRALASEIIKGGDGSDFLKLSPKSYFGSYASWFNAFMYGLHVVSLLF